MRIIVIGGTGFISGAVVRQLHERGHELLLFHRKRSTSFPEVTTERDRLPEFRSDFARFKPDLVLDTILSRERSAAGDRGHHSPSTGTGLRRIRYLR
jgi:nucleoside-diphosphate-sugar epimerase